MTEDFICDGTETFPCHSSLCVRLSEDDTERDLFLTTLHHTNVSFNFLESFLSLALHRTEFTESWAPFLTPQQTSVHLESHTQNTVTDFSGYPENKNIQRGSDV